MLAYNQSSTAPLASPLASNCGKLLSQSLPSCLLLLYILYRCSDTYTIHDTHHLCVLIFLISVTTCQDEYTCYPIVGVTAYLLQGLLIMENK